MSNFLDLLKRPADDITKPRSLPAGTYLGVIKGFQFKESKEKKTPYIEYQVGINSPGDGVDPEALAGVDVSGKVLRKNFYITTDALYRIKDFIESCHISTKGRMLDELIPHTVNQPVLVEVTERRSPDGSDVFNDIGNLKGQS